MTEMIVTTKDGHVRTIDGVAGFSVIEAIRDAGVDELLALRSGGLSSATRRPPRLCRRSVRTKAICWIHPATAMHALACPARSGSATACRGSA